jgi:hypothetical protein
MANLGKHGKYLVTHLMSKTKALLVPLARVLQIVLFILGIAFIAGKVGIDPSGIGTGVVITITSVFLSEFFVHLFRSTRHS